MVSFVLVRSVTTTWVTRRDQLQAPVTIVTMIGSGSVHGGIVLGYYLELLIVLPSPAEPRIHSERHNLLAR